MSKEQNGGRAEKKFLLGQIQELEDRGVADED